MLYEIESQLRTRAPESSNDIASEDVERRNVSTMRIESRGTKKEHEFAETRQTRRRR